MYGLRRSLGIWRWLHLILTLTLILTPMAGAARAVSASSMAIPLDDTFQEMAALSQTPPPPSTGAAPATTPNAASAVPNCALLDDPVVRGMMSGALETALLHACGREVELTPLAVTAPSAPLSPQSVTALGNNVLVNDPAGEMTSMTQSGAVVAYNENNGVLCAAYNDSYHAVVQSAGYTGFSSSADGGATWVDHGALNANSLGYPSLVWRRTDGQFYLATLHASGLGLWRLGANCDAATWVGMIHSGFSDDKEMLTVDNNPASPYYGRLYVAWTDYTNWHIYTSSSDDGGVNWSTPVDVSGHDQVNGAWPAVDLTNGDVYVAWTHWDTYPDGPIDVEMARSTDGGATWNPLINPMSDKVNPRDATATTACTRPALKGNIRYYPYPQIAVDRNRVLHVVYSYDPDGYNTGDVVNVYYRRSTDQGATWETERRLNDDWTGRDQFFPALAVGETGAVGVFWYDRRLDSANVMYDRYMALSRDGGASFEANQRVSDVSSPVVQAGSGMATCYHGDYDGAVAGGGYFYTVWGDDRRGDADVWSDTEPYFWGRLHGTVYNASTRRGIADVHVETVHAPTDFPFADTSDVTGYYEMRIPGGESYSVTARAYGYTPNTITTTVNADGGQADIPLIPVALWSISGRVTDANTGYPVYAHVTVSGNPFNPPAPTDEAWSDPFTGIYNLPNLAAGIPYTLTFQATGYIPLTYFAGELDAHLFNPDLELQPDLAACTAPGYEMAPTCQSASGAVLQPSPLETEGCPCADETHTLFFANHTGVAGEVLLTHATGPGVSVQLPASLGVVPATGVKPFDVALKIDRGVIYSTTVVITVTARMASNPAISDTTVIKKRALEPTAWEARAASPSVSMDGAVIEYGGKLYNVGGLDSGGAVDIYDPVADTWTTGAAEPSPIIDFPGDACFGYATPTDPVILLLPDATGDVTGTWHRYHIVSNTWDTATLPSPLPADGIWAPDIVVDYRANMCYITGGATTAAGGNLTTLYRYDPAANTAVSLGDFTHIPTGFNFHAGWYVPWIGTEGGVCVGGGVDSSDTAYSATQCYDIAAATFNTTNADLGPLPELWWGMADMEKVSANGRQLWLANGINTGGALLQRSAYFSREIGKFVYGPDPLYSVYRVEGAAVQDKVYVVDGSAGSFDPRALTEQLLQCPECDCGVTIAKDASAEWVYPGETVTYTVAITAPSWLTGTAELVDALPAGATFTGYVNATYGTAWYSPTTNAIYWARPTGVYDAAGAGSALEVFTNTWANSAAGLVYNPETDFSRYVHEGSGPEFIHDVARPVPHTVLHSFSLSDVNPGWSDWRTGIGYDYTTGHYFLTDYGGGGSHHDNIAEIDPAGRVLNAWETFGTSNDSYDGSVISNTLDIAVVSGNPPRYFATALFDGGLVHELNLLKAGQFVSGTWGTVMTCTVPGLSDNAGIDYDAQNGVLYHSSWSNDTVVVTDLRCNVLETFTCANGTSGYNSGVTFIEGQWPPEIWVTDYFSNRTTRCEAVGHEPPPAVITVTYAVQAIAPVSTTLLNEAALTCNMPGCADPSAQSILVLRTNDVSGSVLRALDELGYAYDTIYAYSDWTEIDFAPYDTVIIGMDGGTVSITSTQKIRTDVIDLGKRVIFIGGTASVNFVNGVNQYLVANDTANYNWALTTSPHFTLTNAAHPLAQGLPASRNFVNSSLRYYQLRVTDPDIEAIAQNGNGYTSYFYKTYPGGGDLVWFIHTAYGGYWSDRADLSLLEQMLANALLRPRRYTSSEGVHVASRPAITWTKEIYVNGNYVGRYDEGPFTVVPTDDVQLIDRLDYAGVEPLFVQLTEDWGSYPVTLAEEYHTHGALVDGTWSVTLLPGTNARLVKTLHITGAVPVTIQEQLHPEGMASEARSVTFQAPVFVKNGPAVADNGQLITYTLALNSQDPLLGSLRLTDTLPAGVEYADNLSVSYGYAWYNPATRSIHWTNAPASSITRRASSVLEVETTSQIVPAARSTSALLAAASPWLALAPSNTWYEAAPLPTGRVRYAHAQCPGEPNRFYVISGVPTAATANAWRYDADTDTWTTLARLPAPVEGPSAVCYQGHIYVAGGNGTSQFYIYDIARDMWTVGPTLPRGVWGAAFGAWEGRLFLAGGDNDFMAGGASAEVNIYDIAAGKWNALGATMPISTSAAGWTQVNEYLYVVGGWSDSTTNNITATQRYNMADDEWETGPTFTSGRADFVLAATGQYLYAIGGDADGNGFFDTVTLTERLDYTNWYGGATWTDIGDPLPEALSAYNGSFCTTARSGGEIWSVGGLTSGFQYASTSQYRPSEPCVMIPPTVTLTFNALVTASPGERITNTATLDFRGAVFTATTAFNSTQTNYMIYLPLVLRNHAN